MTTWRRDQPLSTQGRQHLKHNKPRDVCIVESSALRLIFGVEPAGVQVPGPDGEPADVVASSVYESHIMAK
ncbi:hypothetical protein [Paenibacillus sp. JJ-100]|uniref:hypothetical protein n=1 Tax=Paenibacillus sp. JJ-100 TaxID=2974896 RepID=UPI00232DFEF3|nr:hypothetical protein [Paenibacillus sp. JJ-100]